MYSKKRMAIKGVHSLLLAAGFILAANSECFAQALLQAQDGFIYVPQPDYIYVDGNVGVTEGTFEQFGALELTGNWTNLSEHDNTGFSASSTGEVKLVGAAQEIQGYASTTFPNLSLEGYDTKRLIVNSKVAHTLNLNNIELDVRGNDMWVDNSAADAITYTRGYVNTSNAPLGRLLRTVDAGVSYVYPLGGGVQYKYRPVTATAEENGVLAAQFQNYNADDDGYDRMRNIATNSNVISDKFYHVVTSINGVNSADIKIPYSSSEDGSYNGLARWTDNHWADAKYYYSGPEAGAGTDQAAHYRLQNGGAHILALTDTIATDNIFVVSGFTPNGDGKNDYFVIKGLENYKFNELKVFDRWGKLVYTTLYYKNDWAGDGLEMGAYMYVLRVVNTNGKERIIKGDVTIIR